MKIKLTRDARIKHLAGETVDVSPAEALFLLTTNSAQRVTEETNAPDETPKPKRAKTRG